MIDIPAAVLSWSVVVLTVLTVVDGDTDWARGSSWCRSSTCSGKLTAGSCGSSTTPAAASPEITSESERCGFWFYPSALHFHLVVLHFWLALGKLPDQNLATTSTISITVLGEMILRVGRKVCRATHNAVRTKFWSSFKLRYDSRRPLHSIC